MKESIYKNSGRIIFFLFSISIFFGFYLNEDGSGGGASTDFNNTWQYILDLKEDLLFTYMNWEHIHLPFHYVILSFINYFFTDKEQIRFIFCLISLSAPILFYLGLRIKFHDLDKNLLLIFASILLVLPTFRYTAIWANVQITALIFFLSSIFFYLKWEKNNKNGIDKNLVFQILFITLATYTRQDYAIFYLYFMILYFQKIKLKKFIILLTLVLILSLPGLLFVYDQSTVLLNIKFTSKFLNCLLVNSSIMSLYLIPILLCLIINGQFKMKKENKFFIISLFLFSILTFIFSYSFDYNYKLGGGFILKLSMILFNNYFLFYLSCILGFVILSFLAKENINNLIIILLLLFGYNSDVIFQKYFEPIFIFIFFLLMQSQITKEFLKKAKNIIFLYIYFAIYLTSAIINDFLELTKQI